jgi:hypothetical protein
MTDNSDTQQTTTEYQKRDNYLASQAANSILRHPSITGDEKEAQWSAVMTMVAGVGAKDDIEGMIATQLVGAHDAAMECYRRAMNSNVAPQAVADLLNQANKLSRTYSILLESLDKHRGKPPQKVQVEHIHRHIHLHGEAAGEGGGEKIEGQPHALGYAESAPLRGQGEAQRESLPLASDAERAVSDARRKVAGRSKGQ